MKVSLPFVLAALVAGSLPAEYAPVAAQQAGEQITVPFSDPGRAGTVRISALNGTVTVRAANRRDVLIETRGAADDRSRTRERATGLRRLQATPGLEAIEENNQMVISSSGHDDTELVIHVPTKTNLKVNGTNGGPITVEGVEGDIEVNNVNESIAVSGVSGSVVAHSTNGDVKVSLTRVNAQKAMAFTSLNGDVDVTLPAALKATLKLRSDRGDVYTDFDLQVRTETATQNTGRENGRFRIAVNRSLTGTLNGGGPEVELRTFNGDVYLRKGAQ